MLKPAGISTSTEEKWHPAEKSWEVRRPQYDYWTAGWQYHVWQIIFISCDLGQEPLRRKSNNPTHWGRWVVALWPSCCSLGQTATELNQHWGQKERHVVLLVIISLQRTHQNCNFLPHVHLNTHIVTVNQYWVARLVICLTLKTFL